DDVPAQQDPGRVAVLRDQEARRLAADHRRQHVPVRRRRLAGTQGRAADPLDRRGEAGSGVRRARLPGAQCGPVGRGAEALAGRRRVGRQRVRAADGSCEVLLARTDLAGALSGRRAIPAQHVMKAVGLYRNLPIDDPESLVDLTVPKPAPSQRELLVEVKAISVNPVDYKIRARPDPNSPQPRILGWDAAGIVREVGAGAQLFKPGDEVYYAGSIQKPGANSEFHVVDERIVGHKPRTLNFAAAAALPLTTLTAWE